MNVGSTVGSLHFLGAASPTSTVVSSRADVGSSSGSYSSFGGTLHYIGTLLWHVDTSGCSLSCYSVAASVGQQHPSLPPTVDSTSTKSAVAEKVGPV